MYGVDPRFRDAERGDLRIRPDGPAGRAGARAEGVVSGEGRAMRARVLCAALLAARPPRRGPPRRRPEQPRLVVLTDISSLTAGEAEPDDGQSLIRLMLYTNEFDIEGLIASSNLGHGQRVRPELIRQVVDAYGKVRPNLLLHDARYPPAEGLRDGIKAGQPVAGPKVPVTESVGEGKDTEASDWIIRVVDRDDPRPVWVVIWGGSADLAQALWKVRRDRSPEELARFVAKLRVHAIGDQDSTGPWLREQFPGCSRSPQRRAYRGMYRGGDTALASPSGSKKHIHGHGPLGDLYPDYDGGDIWSSKLGQVRGIKEGDTPSFLSLVPNGLGDSEHPRLGSWGGRFEGKGETDRRAGHGPGHLGRPRPPDVVGLSLAAGVPGRLRRPGWTGASSPTPRPTTRRSCGSPGTGSGRSRPGDVVTLDAGGTTDPDGDGLDFSWSVYPATPEVSRKVVIEGRDTRSPKVVIAPELAGKSVPILLSVTDRGEPRLTRYGRVLIKVVAAE